MKLLCDICGEVIEKGEEYIDLSEELEMPWWFVHEECLRNWLDSLNILRYN